MHALVRIVSLLVLCSCSQSGVSEIGPTSGAQTSIDLSAYEGLYEYEYGTTLIMVAGPENEILYASINEARYPLRPIRRDVFLNGGDIEVVFVRSDSDDVIGYREQHSATSGGNPLYRMLDRTKRLPSSIWRARPNDSKEPYRYRVPDMTGDGIPVRSLSVDDPLLAQLSAMTTEIYADAFPGLQSVLLYKDGALVFEEYFYEFKRDTPHQLRSATKTLIALLAGAAIDSGQISSIDEKVLPYFGEYKNLRHVDDHKRALTIRDLLSMRSGFDCNDWDGTSRGNENNMIHTDDWAGFILDLPMTNPPGSKGSYCSGNVILIGKIIEKSVGKPLAEFADDVLFGPLGISHYQWDFRPDLSNVDNFVQAWLRPRDMMKIGILLAGGGTWNGRQVISREWVAEMTSDHSDIGNTPYGYFFWRRYRVINGQHIELPQASGNGGQKIILLKNLDAILVLTGGGYNQQSHTSDLLSQFILAGPAP